MYGNRKAQAEKALVCRYLRTAIDMLSLRDESEPNQLSHKVLKQTISCFVQTLYHANAISPTTIWIKKLFFLNHQDEIGEKSLALSNIYSDFT